MREHIFRSSVRSFSKNDVRGIWTIEQTKTRYIYQLPRIIYSGFLLDLFYYGAFWVGGGADAIHIHGVGLCFRESDR